jgi:hypothetical protein
MRQRVNIHPTILKLHPLLTLQEIATLWNCSRDTVRNEMRRHGITATQPKTDYTDWRFGKLKVLGRESTDKHRTIWWTCFCRECYNIVIIDGKTLRKARDCGCTRKHKGKSRNR